MGVVKKIYELIVNNKDANKELDKTRDKVEGVTKETQNLGKESGKTKEKYGSLFSLLEDGFGSIKQTVKDFGNASMDVWNGAVNQGVKFAKMLSSALPAGFKISSLAAKGFAVALAATGITLITTAVAILIDYFKNFEGAVKMVDKILAVLKETMYVVIDSFKALFTLDFTGFLNSISESGDRISDAASAIDDLYDAQKRYAELNRQSTVDNAKLVAEQERLVKVLDDTTLSTEARMAAAVGLDGINKQLLANDKALLATKREEIEAQLVNTRNYEEIRDLKQELADITAEEIENESKLSQINQDTAQRRREIAESEEAKREKEIAKIKERLDETEKARIANLESEEEKIEAEFQMTLEGIREKYGKGTELEKQLTIAKNRKLREIKEKEEEEAREKEQKILDKIKEFGAKETKTREEILKERTKAEKEIIDSSKSLSKEEKVELKLAAENRLKDGLIAIEDEKLKKLQEIRNEYIPEDEVGLSEAEKFELERERKREQFEKELEDLEIEESKKAKIREKYKKREQKEKDDFNETAKENRRKATEAEVGMTIAAVGSIVNALAEGSALAKGFAVAQALFNTYEGITKALTAPTLPQRIAGIAFASAAGFGAVKNILSTSEDGSSAQAQNASGGRGVTPPRDDRRANFSIAGDSDRVRNAEIEAERDDKPVEAYVVSKKVTSQQELDRTKNNNSKFI